MSGGGGARLMSCVREGSLEPPYRPPHTHVAKDGEGRTGRFLRGLRRMFKRRGSASRTDASPDPKSSSTSELLHAEAQGRRKEGAYSSGLSVSHDSVFTGERSGDESSDDRPSANVGLGHIITSHRAELVAAVRRRGRGDASDDDEDLGLPRSPPASPPTDKADKRHHAGISQSSCSDGSLLSVGSSEMDEDSSSLHHHSHENSARSDHSDLYNSSEPPSGVAPLSHSAAKHKMAVRPRRTHGAPRRKKTNPIAASALPITPELNEEFLRSATPEVMVKTSEVTTETFSSSSTTKHTVATHQQHLSRDVQRVLDVQSDAKLKSSSLPPGLALSQLVGQSPAKLSIAENNTPRSSIKRSKSSSQDQSIRESTQKTQGSASETKIHNYHERIEEKTTKYREEHRHVEESCHEKKSKSEKKIENEVIKSSKKEESFFSRLLLRKSGKKSKKDQLDAESQQDVKKSKMDKPTAQYKSVDIEKNMFSSSETAPPLGPKPVLVERTQKSAAQKVFANQMHKRLDNKGAYVQDNVYKDAYGGAKTSSTAGIGYNLSDLKIAEETDRMLNLEIRIRCSRRSDFNEKIDKVKRSSSKDSIEDKKEPFSLHHDKSKRPSSVQRLVDPFSTKAFLDNELANAQKEKMLSPILISDEESPIRTIRMPKVQSDYTFHSGSMPKSIPYFNPNIVVSSIHPSKNIRHSSENVKSLHRSSEHVHDLFEKPIQCKHEKIHHSRKTEESYVNSAFRSLGDEYVETRSSIGKSHSFRYASESPSISSQESQMPSLPAIVGISEPLLESWEVNYRRNVSDRHDPSKRISARNYNILQNNNETNYDSLQSTDSSYLDSLKTESNDENKLFTNSIHITMDHHKRDSAISQIEAKIDDIISSPKPIIASILKSSSLDSVKSSPEKQVEDRRKTISVESALSHSGKVNSSSIQKDLKQESENFISVTQINRDVAPIQSKSSENKTTKSDDKTQKSGATKPGVPEFLKIQLNKVDNKPSNVVLTANVTPKKPDNQQAEKEFEYFEVNETKPMNIQSRRDSGGITKVKDHFTQENTQIELKKSPVVVKKVVNVTPPVIPQSPSTPKLFFKRKSASVESQDKPEKQRTNSMSTEGSTEKIFDNISMDQKSHSSFGSKSSIQSSDSNEMKTPDRDDAVVYRKKPVIGKELRSDKKNDDEPELMKVFARRSLKLKDCEVDSLAQEIAENNMVKEEIVDNVNASRTKILKNEFNASIKSRDSDKENDETISKEQNEEKRLVDIAARVSQFGAPHYQRSVSITSVSSTNNKRDSTPTFRSEVNKYKKEVSDSTPEKRLRNRTFPDPSNDRDDIKGIAKTESYKADTLKRPWQKKDEERIRFLSVEKEKRLSAEKEKRLSAEKEAEKRLSADKDKRVSMEKDKRVSIEKDKRVSVENEKRVSVGEEREGGAATEAETDEAASSFRGILHVRAEWERRARTQHAK